jgi:hypothetical protein
MNNPSPQTSSNAIIHTGMQPDVTYLNTVRTTITTLDGHRMTAINYGIVIPSTALIASATAIHNFRTENPALGYVLSAFLIFTGILIAIVYMLKVNMFNDFIGEAVRIALDIERRVGIPEELRLTNGFEKHWAAGSKGARITGFFGLCFIVIVSSSFVAFVWTLHMLYRVS